MCEVLGRKLPAMDMLENDNVGSIQKNDRKWLMLCRCLICTVFILLTLLLDSVHVAVVYIEIGKQVDMFVMFICAHAFLEERSSD
jgi:hypothetical protein